MKNQRGFTPPRCPSLDLVFHQCAQVPLPFRLHLSRDSVGQYIWPLLYVEATATQQSRDWLAAHVNALHAAGCAPKILVPDDTSTAVRRALRVVLPHVILLQAASAMRLQTIGRVPPVRASCRQKCSAVWPPKATDVCIDRAQLSDMSVTR